ncbi:HesA/MoeB/ThiF family protein [Candidatus Woesearchaeota archaeon]|nr:HesA/MoeB/ThiF family protein [Candidatus Woesearchaeota archaeon]
MEKKRYYHQHVVMKEIGLQGQEKISNSSVAIIGAGALGGRVAELLVRAGVGKLTVIDRDIIEESNLQRQTLFLPRDVGRSKALIAKERLQEINPITSTKALPIHLNAKNIISLQKARVVVDCTDNFETRFLLNDFCKKEKIPLVYGAAIMTEGYAMAILPEGPCLSCFLKEASLETCETLGVLNTITTSIAAIQATLTFKVLVGEKISPILYYYDIWQQSLKSLNVKKRVTCQTCKGIYTFLNKDGPIKMIKFCSTNLYQIMGEKIALSTLKRRWEKMDRVTDDKEALRFKEILLFKDGRALIDAPSEQAALAIYSKWIGS